MKTPHNVSNRLKPMSQGEGEGSGPGSGLIPHSSMFVGYMYIYVIINKIINSFNIINIIIPLNLPSKSKNRKTPSNIIKQINLSLDQTYRHRSTKVIPRCLQESSRNFEVLQNIFSFLAATIKNQWSTRTCFQYIFVVFQ